MKYLKFFESNVEDTTERDILDNFEYISDSIGKPKIDSFKFGNSKKWRITWDLKMDIDSLTKPNELIKKLKQIISDIDDVLSASERLPQWNFNMRLSNRLLIIEMNPKDSGDEEYQFIKIGKWETIINCNEVERYFNSHDIFITKFKDISEEYSGYSHLKIFLTSSNYDIISDFKQRIKEELNVDGGVDFDFYIEGNVINISSKYEKCFISFSRS